MERSGMRAAVVTVGALLSSMALTAAADDDSAWRRWMKETLVPAKASADWKRVEELNRKLAAANPDPSAMPRWREFCEQGAAAAKKADKEGVQRSCAGCHGEYRKLFKERFRSSPPPK